MGSVQELCWTEGVAEEEDLGEGCVLGQKRLLGLGGSQEFREGKLGTIAQENHCRFR